MFLYTKVHNISLEHVNQFEKYPMNNKLSKAFIKHYKVCFLILKELVNIFQFFENYIYFENLLHKI